jgi:hypothetical protein
MTNKEIEKYEQELTNLSKAVNDLRTVQDANKRHSDTKNLYQQLQTLAVNIPSPLFNANMLNTDINVGKSYTAAVESNCGELINNIHRALQTKMMLNACVSAEQSSTTAKWACIWAAVAAVSACISVIFSLVLWIKGQV